METLSRERAESMTDSEIQTVLNKINFYAQQLADSAKVAYWVEADNKKFHIDDCKGSIKVLNELIYSL